MNLAGIVGAAADGPAWATKARALLNRAHVRERPLGGDGGGGVIDIFYQGVKGDAGTLRRLTGRNNEKVALGVHLVLAEEGGLLPGVAGVAEMAGTMGTPR